MVTRGRPRFLWPQMVDDNDDCSYICGVCQDFGDLLCCEQCGQGFHLACLNLKSMPEETLWLCNDCKENKVCCFQCKDIGTCTNGSMVRCLHTACRKFYHRHCIVGWESELHFSASGHCPQHICVTCQSRRNSGQIKLFRCLECPRAYHKHCRPDGSRLLEKIPGCMICPNHHDNDGWIQAGEKVQNAGRIFQLLPVPNQFCEFEVPRMYHEFAKKLKARPQPFVHIRRNVYLVKKPKKRLENQFMQCACARAGGVRASCERDCICSMLQYSCSDGCGCGPSCTNLPFQKRRGCKIDLIKTEKCGWGIVAAEKIKAGDFIIEYIGEVIDDKTCEERLWGMKERSESNFYMCEINREMVIDATFKGNLSRFINHSCCPNTQLQKWQIDEEVRIGVFAISDIAEGEAISYDYQFIPFGQEQVCHCGASACRGKLGRKPSKQKILASVALQIVRTEIFGLRPIKKSRLCGSGIADDCHSIDHIFGQRELKFGMLTKCGAIVRKRVQKTSCTTACLGLRVRIWWPLDQKFYSGKIVEYDSVKGNHKIQYDDGECEVLNMHKERWELEEPVMPLRKRRPGILLEESYTPPASSGEVCPNQLISSRSSQDSR